MSREMIVLYRRYITILNIGLGILNSRKANMDEELLSFRSKDYFEQKFIGQHALDFDDLISTAYETLNNHSSDTHSDNVGAVNNRIHFLEDEIERMEEELRKQKVIVENIDKIEIKKIPLSSKVSVEQSDFDKLKAVVGKYVVQAKKENKLEKLLNEAKKVISTLKQKIVELTQELAQYKSVKGNLDSHKLKSENYRLKKENTQYKRYY